MKIPQAPTPWMDLMNKFSQNNRLGEIFRIGSSAKARRDYLHWNELRHRTPPAGLELEEWWLAIKMHRQGRATPLLDKKGASFTFNVPDCVVEQLHQIDKGGGTLIIPEPVTNPQTRDRYLMRSLIAEAITSSQLEGAVTTREVAKEMLSSGRKPRDKSERMILNNFLTMQRIRQLKDSPLTADLVLEIHRMVGEEALDKADAAGRLRRADEMIDVSDHEGNIFHVPPDAKELPERLDAMCRFANGETPDFFIHPVVRSVILHFWLAYDHPFIDGNGRTARALFYWSMLRNGFWLFEFISISEIILKAPVKYGMAFLHTETDENDLTYFLIHQTDVIRKAVQGLHEYIEQKTQEIEETRTLIDGIDWANHRQQGLLAHAMKHPGQRYTVAEHRGRHGIVYQTARTDLLELANHDLLEKRVVGKEFIFRAPADLVKRLKQNQVRNNEPAS